MDIAEEIARFADDLRGQEVLTKTTAFSSGAVILDIRRGDRLFVLAYSPTWPGFGVDEVMDDDDFGTSYRFGFSDFESAKAKMMSILNQATDGPS